MKKLLTLLLAAGMVVSAANGASAVEMKVSGSWLTSFSFTNNLYGAGGLLEKDYASGPDANGKLHDPESGHFNAAQRIRINFDMVASESLSGRVQLQVGQGQNWEDRNAPGYYSWGSNGVAGPGEEVTARLAYLDWIIPSTDVLVRMGRQEVAMPSYTFNSPVLDDVIDGVMVSAPINDMVAVNLGWMRADALISKWDPTNIMRYEPHSSQDLAYLGVDVTADGFKVSPWGMVGFVGSNSVGNPVIDVNEQGEMKYLDATTHYYWAGIGGELTIFDPFKFTADFIYGGNDADGWGEEKGWYAALGAEMKTSFATPFVKGWYASGDDADSKERGALPEISGAFDASSIYFDANGLLAASIDRCNPNSTWGVQAGVKDVSFIEDLTHALSVTYFQGTNNTDRLTTTDWRYRTGDPLDVNYMTTADSAWSIDFLSSYKLYQNLTANLLLSYLITDFDESIRPYGADGKVKFDNAFRGTMNFTYAF